MLSIAILIATLTALMASAIIVAVWLDKKHRVEMRNVRVSNDHMIKYLIDNDFVSNTIFATEKLSPPETRIFEQLRIYNILKGLEQQYNLSCKNLDSLRDKISDTIGAITNPTALVDAIGSSSLFSGFSLSFTEDAGFLMLNNEEKIRILHIRCDAYHNGHIFDLNNVKPELQCRLLKIDKQVEDYANHYYQSHPRVPGSYLAIEGYRHMLLSENCIDIKSFGQLNPSIYCD